MTDLSGTKLELIYFMRIARSIQLSQDNGIVHKYWKCHNSEFLLNTEEVKKLCQRSTDVGLNHLSVQNNVQLHAFCIMDNHCHQLLTYLNDSHFLSKYMHVAHSLFGRVFNDLHDRSGKVANERPKTPLIQNEEHAMRVHFYIEANPIKARMVKLASHLAVMEHNSYRFYAYGIKSVFTKNLILPSWYLELGKTDKERRRRYRNLFEEYIRGYLNIPFKVLSPFIGEQLWVVRQEDRVSMEKTPKPPH